jgi:hypothetical protein
MIALSNHAGDCLSMLASRTHWAFLILLLISGRCPAASERDELLRYVPDEAGFCMVVQNLRGTLADLRESPFARAWNISAQGTAVARAPEWKQIEKVEQYLEKNLGVGWPALRDDILGGVFLFTYQPGPTGKPEDEKGLFGLRARNPRTLATLVQKLNELQKGTGELKELVDRVYKGVKYVRRVENKTTNFYLLDGPVLLFTGQEAFLQQAIDCSKARAESDPPLAGRLKDLGLDRALVALTINPRAFDDAIRGAATQKAAPDKAASDPAGKTLAGIWKAIQAIGVGVHVERDLRFTLTVQAKTEQLPASARRFLSSAARTSALWGSFPDNALLAAGGRLDLSSLYEMLGQMLTPASRDMLSAGLERGVGAMLGKDVVKEVLPAVGPDWGLCVVAPTAGNKSWAPRMHFAVRVAAGEGSDPVDQALLSAVHSAAQMAVLGHNNKSPTQPISLRTVVRDKVRIRYLYGESTFPAGVRPAFALKSGYFIFASAPEVIQQLRLTRAPATGTTPLMRMSFKDLRTYLDEHRDALTAELARRDEIPKEKARERIEGFRRGIEWIDRVELTQKTTAGQVGLTLTVQTSQALKK